MKHEKQIGRQRQRRGFRVAQSAEARYHPAAAERLPQPPELLRPDLDDGAGRTLVAASTLDKQLREEVRYGGNKAAAAAVGKAIAQRALEAGIKEVVFDRREYKYHGRVAALADAAREAGLVF